MDKHNLAQETFSLEQDVMLLLQYYNLPSNQRKYEMAI